MLFSLSGTADGETLSPILADIPFIAVGVLASFTLSFFFVLNRLSLICACLHAAALAAFIASIIDLSQTLSWNNSNAYVSLSSSASSAGYIASDIGFAVSITLRLLFFWFYVAEPPRTEASLVSNYDSIHSGSWQRLGLVGSIFRWITLLMIIIVFILQLIWRIDHVFAGFSPLYNASAAIEIILSALLLLKLGLNTWICSVAPRRKTVLTYAVSIVALGLNVGIGMGNLVSLKFTESVLGRSLLAFEFYSMIFSIAIATFYPLRASGLGLVTTRPASSFFQLPRSRLSPIDGIPAISSTPYVNRLNAVGPDMNAKEGRPAPTLSATSRVSSWLASRGWQMSGRLHGSETDQGRLWKHGEIEGCTSPVYRLHPGLQAADKTTEDNPYMLGSPTTSTLNDYVRVNFKNSESRMGHATPYAPTPVTLQSPISASKESATLQPSRSPSPVFGLGSPILSSSKKGPGSLSRESSKASGISGLLRRQAELDKTILALHLFNNRSPSSKTEDGSISRDSSFTSDTRRKRSKRPSIFSRSEISLSHFPPPPKSEFADVKNLKSPTFESSIKSFVQKPDSAILHRSDPSITTVSDFVDDLLPPQMPSFNPSIAENTDLPHDLKPPRMPAAVAESRKELSLSDYDMESEVIVSARTPKVDSLGTQYDVTSFIGNLTKPTRHKKDGSVSGSSEADVTIVNRSNSAQYARPIYVGSRLENPLLTDPVTNRTGVGRGAGQGRPLTSPKLDVNSSTEPGADNLSRAFDMPEPAPSIGHD